eukprot:1157455-Pelagomonas_calceolata.AAC.9
MMRLNLSEEAAAAIVEEDKLAGGGGAQQGHAKAQQQEHEAPGDMVLDPFAEDEAASPAAHASSHHKQQPEGLRNSASGSAPGAAGVTSHESVDDWEAEFDLFADECGAQGESAASAEHETSASGMKSDGGRVTPSAGQEAPSPSSTADTAVTGGGDGRVTGQGAGKQGRVEQRPAPLPSKQQQQQQKGGAQIKAALQPRALLFQQCQRARWAQPRYDKLPGPAMQYSVSARVQCAMLGWLAVKGLPVEVLHTFAGRFVGMPLALAARRNGDLQTC